MFYARETEASNRHRSVWSGPEHRPAKQGRATAREQGATAISHVTTHVLDNATGLPAPGIAVALATADGATLGSGTTDADGRVADLGPERLEAGTYRLDFATGDYFAARGQETFFPEVSVAFTVDSARHCHVPLLLSPFAFSTYRGS